jgi:hypothetical protein
VISLSATTYDPNGVLVLPIRIRNAYQGKRRSTVTATLDGGSAVYDTGYSISDQTFTANMIKPTKAQLLSLQYLVAYYGEIIVCCESGAFRALLEFALSKNSVSISLRLLRRVDS